MYFFNMQYVGGLLHHGWIFPKATMGHEFIKKNPLTKFSVQTKIKRGWGRHHFQALQRHTKKNGVAKNLGLLL